ncbi:MAG: hypothetical protein AAGG69_07095, partial [Pseudomonadota bacterium]
MAVLVRRHPVCRHARCSDGDIGADGSVSQKQLRHFTGSAATGGRKIASLRIDERSFDRLLFFNS